MLFDKGLVEKINRTIPGFLLCLALALPAWQLGRWIPVVGAPVFAIFIGLFLGIVVKNMENYREGILVVSKKLLQLAVVLLGFGMNLSVVARIGLESLPVIVATIGVALLVSYGLYKAFKTPANLAILIGVGSSICGGSAIAATAPVIGARDEEVCQAVSVIFFFNVLAALIFPGLGDVLGLSNEGFSLFAGTAINDTSSVTAAAASWDGIHGSNTLEPATVVKLTRTLAIIPITLVLALRQVKRNEAGDSLVSLGKIFPFFILFFLLASFLTTLSPSLGIPDEWFSPLKNLSRFLIVMAMGAIGLNTNVKGMVSSGFKPLLTGLVCWLSIIAVSLWFQRGLGML